jgi:flagellum-specific ATP synthase
MNSVVARLAERRAVLQQLPPPPVEGRLTRMVGLALEAVGVQAAVGDHCDIQLAHGGSIEAEVVGFSGDRIFLMPTGTPHGLEPSAAVVPSRRSGLVKVGSAMLGRIIDGAGEPLDGLGPIVCEEAVRLTGSPINPLSRVPISTPLDVGVRTLNALLTVGRGQRLGLFAGSGIGKSVLLGMMARHTVADVIVVGLIGERGREVRDFVDRILGQKERHRAVVVAAPSDQPPLMRLHGAWLATSIAEYFRDQGKSVLLIMDSLTRFAQAQREIGLAIGEAPATKGYPPSVFARLPALVERAGNGVTERGSITAFYTVLTEGDDPNDPIADAARAILDGHVVLSRRLADAGHYPAIDLEQSVSRVMHDIVDPKALAIARQARQYFSLYQQVRDFIALGLANRDRDPRIAAAMQIWPRLEKFLTQDIDERADFESSTGMLRDLLAQPVATAGEGDAA